MEQLINAEIPDKLEKAVKLKVAKALKHINRESLPALCKKLSILHLRYNFLRASLLENASSSINKICKKLLGDNRECRIETVEIAQILQKQEEQNDQLIPLSQIIEWRSNWIEVLSNSCAGIDFKLSQDEIYRSLDLAELPKIIATVRARIYAIAAKLQATPVRRKQDLAKELEALSINHTDAIAILGKLEDLIENLLTEHLLSAFNHDKNLLLTRLVEKYNLIEKITRAMLCDRQDPSRLFEHERKLLQLLQA